MAKAAAKSEKVCAISREDFQAKAPQTVTITVIAEKKEFSTGSFGFYANGKTTVMIDGQPVPLQIGANFTVPYSKEA